jgi:protocatechuate 3,4-dioxygenase beta subunit
MLERVLGIGGLAALGGSVFAQEAKRLLETTAVELGPFYPVERPKDLDADLTLITGHKKRAEGNIIYISGRVLNQKGEAVSGAKIEIWQANTHGRYNHPSDTNSVPLDDNFQGVAVLKTDSQGRYHFKTIKPGPYPSSPTTQRTPHIHFDITGKENRLTTQMFFPNEPLNEKDGIFKYLQKEESNYTSVITKRMPPTKEMEAGATLFNWDIVLLDG